MPRRDPPDYAGAWWHLTNRGIAERAVFENGHDVEQFLALLHAVVQEGRLEIHAFTVLTTHFHLLVRSPIGERSAARRIRQSGYSRTFNRSRTRDGPVVREYGTARPSRHIERAPALRTIRAHAPPPTPPEAAAKPQPIRPSRASRRSSRSSGYSAGSPAKADSIL